MAGRVCGGVIQVGDRLRILPGDESGNVKCTLTFLEELISLLIRHIAIEQDEESVPWAAAGANITLHLTNVDPIHLAVGSVLCLPEEVIPLASEFNARLVVFDIEVPITAGASVSLRHCLIYV